eukprot:3286970-Pleurochrysis_carterae.AAC.1
MPRIGLLSSSQPRSALWDDNPAVVAEVQVDKLVTGAPPILLGRETLRIADARLSRRQLCLTREDGHVMVQRTGPNASFIQMTEASEPRILQKDQKIELLPSAVVWLHEDKRAKVLRYPVRWLSDDSSATMPTNFAAATPVTSCAANGHESAHQHL